jgi:hypothetical protein
MLKVSPASLQIFIDTPKCVLEEDTTLTLTPSVIPNYNYVIIVSDWNCLKYFCAFLYCNHQVHRDFLITLYNTYVINWDLYPKSNYTLIFSVVASLIMTIYGWNM